MSPTGEVLNDRMFVLWKSFRALDVVFFISFRNLYTRLRKSQLVVLAPSVVGIYRKDGGGVLYWKLSNETRKHSIFVLYSRAVRKYIDVQIGVVSENGNKILKLLSDVRLFDVRQLGEKHVIGHEIGGRYRSGGRKQSRE